MKVYVLMMTAWYYRSDVKGVYSTLEEAKARGDEENESPVKWIEWTGYWVEETNSDCQLEIWLQEVDLCSDPC